MTLLEIQRYQRSEFEQELQRKTAEAPAFFQQTPVILSLDMAPAERAAVPLAELVDLCRNHGLLPVALRSGCEQLQARARELQLALLPEGRSRPVSSPVPAETASADTDTATSAPVAEAGTRDDAAANEAGDTAAASPAPGNRVITTPVRSGQQVYAAGGDLIVLASVSTGAEVLADGNIHVYGALRGRALAGVRGDVSARIFCQSLEAELISVAGDFKLDEDFRQDWWKQAVQISLDDAILSIEALTR